MEWIHHRHRVGELFGGGGLEPGEPVHRDDVDAVPPRLRAVDEPLLEHRLRAALDHVQQPCGARLLPGRGEVDDHRDELVPEPGMSPDVLVNTDRRDVVEPVRVIDQAAFALGDDRAVGRMPRHAQPRGHAGDGEVIEDDALQRPPHSASRDLRSRRRSPAGVFPPRPPAVHAPIPTHPNQQRGRSVPERLVREPPGHRVPRYAFGAAFAAPRIGFCDPALEHRTIRFEPLPGGFEAELVEAAERGQVNRREGSAEHVEVFRMDSVRTPSWKTSTPTRAATRYPPLHPHLRRAALRI